MDKETLSNYGWIVICLLVLAVMLALATPFGTFVADGFKATYTGLFDTGDNAMDTALGAVGVKNTYDCGHDKSESGNHTTQKECGHYECNDCGCTPASCGVEGHWSGDGKDHTKLASSHRDFIDTLDFHYYACQCVGWTVPENGTYTTTTGTVYQAGDIMPCYFRKTKGDVYTDTDYQYTWSDVSGGAAWKVVVIDKTKTEYPMITDYIAGKEVTYMDSTYYGCSNLIIAPEIPECVTVMRCAFYNCTSLTTAPEIPSNVANLVATFQNCKELTGTIVVKTDKITSNNSSSDYPGGHSSGCFTYTEKPIKLVGTGENDNVLALLAATDILKDNVTY